MYFITTLRICGHIIDDCRTIGMKSSYAGCYYDILTNAVDMFEGHYYEYAVITYIDEGYYPDIVEQQWFRNTETGIEICDKPEQLGDYQLYIIG